MPFLFISLPDLLLQIVDSSLIYDLLQLVGETFQGKDVELILTVLRSIGFRLRKDNPLRLKELILLLQAKAAESKLSQTRYVRNEERSFVKSLMATALCRLPQFPS